MPSKSKALPRQRTDQARRLPSQRSWQRARRVMLEARKREAAERDEAVCVDCARGGVLYPGPAVDGHHIVPRAARPDLVHHPGNVIFLCKRHHAMHEQLGH